ncbi:MAG: molecular chaperone Hsp33 [Oleiphilaceae bacterium]|jgi:molecular chaperone Hsp33
MINNDTFQRFLFEELQIRGEWVRLGKSFVEATNSMNYPLAIKSLLGQTIAASVLLTGTLKFAGRLSIHARGQGPVSLLTAETTNLRHFRALAKWDGDIQPELDLKGLLGDAQLAITIDPDRGTRYQGIVPMEKNNISECLEHYFELSEQLDTYLLLGANDQACYGLLLQKLPDYRKIEDQDAWNRVVHLAKTMNHDELLNADNETLVTRLFHQEQVILYPSESVVFECTCSEDRSLSAIHSLGKVEALEILEQEEVIVMDCQFCGASYRFDRNDVQKLFSLDPIQ